MQRNKHLPPSKLAILLFGGVRPLARAIDKAQSSVSKWQKSQDGGIPRKVHAVLLAVAKRKGIELTAEDLIYGRDISKSNIAELRTTNKIDARIKT